MLLVCYAAYISFILGLNTWLARQIKGVSGFFNRRFGVWLIALSFVACWFGAGSTVGQIQQLHNKGMSGLWSVAIPSFFSCMLVWWGFSRRIASQPALSLPEAIEGLYGPWARRGLALVVVLSSTVYIASELVAVGELLSHVYHMSRLWVTMGFCGVVVLYAAMAGFLTVVVTDICHFTLFTVGLMILTFYTLHAVPLLPYWQAALPSAGYWQLLTHPMDQIVLTVVFVLGWSIDPLVWQRMRSTQSPQTAFWSAGIGTLIITLLFVIISCIGLSSGIFLPDSHDAAMVRMAEQVAKPAALTLILLGLITAMSSTLDSSLNIGSLTLTHDLYKGLYQKLVHHKASEHHLLRIARLTTILMAIPGTWIALVVPDIIQLLWVAADIYVCTLFFPLVSMLWHPHPTGVPARRAGQLAMLAGCLYLLLQGVVRAFHFPWLGWPYTTLVGFTASGVVYGSTLAYMKIYGSPVSVRSAPATTWH